VLKAEADGNGQAMDTMAIRDIRDLLFGNGLGGDDLMARDVQRGRDDGIADYNSLRVAAGLPAVTSFGQITQNVRVASELAAAYPGGVDTIDAFEGGLAEDPVPGSDVGPLFQAIMVNQFQRLRDGDRFFYLNESASAEENSLFQQENSLAKVIQANTNITNLQANAVVFQASISGVVTAAPNGKPAPGGAATAGLAGIAVNLLDENGDILATEKTDQNGAYRFTEQSGPSSNPGIAPGVCVTGVYKVAVVLPPGFKQASANPGAVKITRGDTQVSGVNFTLTPPPAVPAKPVRR
jgi:hypothetical protein